MQRFRIHDDGLTPDAYMLSVVREDDGEIWYFLIQHRERNLGQEPGDGRRAVAVERAARVLIQQYMRGPVSNSRGGSDPVVLELERNLIDRQLAERPMPMTVADLDEFEA